MMVMMVRVMVRMMMTMMSEAGMKTGFRNPLQNAEFPESSWSVAIWSAELDIRTFREIWRRVVPVRVRIDGRFCGGSGVPVAIREERSIVNRASLSSE